MAHIATGSANIMYDSLGVIPLGGQSEFGQMLWVFTYGGEIILVDAGAAYPSEDLPGVDLLLPNTNFLEANQERIVALLLTNGHEEHSGAVNYLLRHVSVPRIMAPRFVSQLLSQSLLGNDGASPGAKVHRVLDTVELRVPYEIGPFEVEWMRVNNAIADACALRIGTPEGTVIYTSSFKLDQTPVDKQLMDIHEFANSGDKGVSLLISDSAGVENEGYTPSESSLKNVFAKHLEEAPGRVIVIFPGTNTHRLQILFDVAAQTNRKVVLLGESLLRTALVAAVSGNLVYDRRIESTVEELPKLEPEQCLIIASGIEDDPLNVLSELAYGNNPEFSFTEGDTVIYSASIVPGKLRHMAMILDQLLSLGVKAVRDAGGVHVSKHASREELKLMLSLTKPRYFIPSIGEGRHIMHHAQLAIDWGLEPDDVYPINNGDILEIRNGIASVIGSVESQAVLFNREQGERVTTFSVHERRALSLEGVLSISLVVNDRQEILAGPSIVTGAAAFMKTAEWQETHQALRQAIIEAIERYAPHDDEEEVTIGSLRAAVREVAIKMLRSKMQAKPTIQVVVHKVQGGLD